jgi:acyl-CoA oxidase
VNYHLTYYIYWAAKRHLTQINPPKCPNVRKHLENMILIYGLNELSQDSRTLYECGYLKAGDRERIWESLKTKITEVRPQVVNIVDAFDYPDFVINSCIGNSYGDIYE